MSKDSDAKSVYLEVPVGGEPQPVAGGAERLRHGRDEAHAAREPRHLPHLRRHKQIQ